jgi:carbon dioxide concentrating mechanism protein CcmO
MNNSSLSDPRNWIEATSRLNLEHLDSIGILETLGWAAALVALDEMYKAANIAVLQAEWNDMLGSVIKIAGSTSDVQSALQAGLVAAHRFHPNLDAGQVPRTLIRLINRPDEQALRAILSPEEYNMLIEQSVVKQPREMDMELSTHQSSAIPTNSTGKNDMSNHSQALGFIETQGFTAVFEAIDTACKAASVEVVGKEKLGGGYVTVVIRGDVAAVSAAIEAAKPRVEGLGKLIACHVIARPSSAALSLLPK